MSSAGAGASRKRGWEEMVKQEPMSGEEEVEVEVPVEEGNDSWWWDGKVEEAEPEGSVHGVQNVKDEWWAEQGSTDDGHA